MSDPESTEVFDQIGPLKADAAIALGFDTEVRIAATGPGPAFPTVLRTLADAVPPRDGATIVDLGAGLGGAGRWIADQTGARLISVEPAAGARSAARRLFPDLDVRAGSAEDSGLPDGIADAVVLLGVVSLVDDLGDALGEARRLLRPDGVLGIADMFLDDARAGGDDRPAVERHGANTLRTMVALTSILAEHGFEVTAVGCADDATPDDAWREPAGELRDWLIAHHDGEEAIVAWLEDQEQLVAWIDSGHVYGGSVVARLATCDSDRSPSDRRR